MATPTDLYSTVLRSGRTTYFVDIREAKNGTKFLSISESRLETDEKRQRTTVRIFGEMIGQFRQAIDEAASSVAS